MESEVIWGLRWGLPQAEFLTPQELRSQRGFRWFGLGPLQSGDTTLFLRCSPWWQEVDRCIGGEVSLSGDDDSAVLPHTFGCGSLVRARPRDDGYAFPGRREFLAQSFEAGRVVSRWESCWFSVPSSGDILLGSARGAYKTVEVTFHCTKQILWLLPPTTLDGGAALGYTGIPSVERSLDMQLCPTTATTLRGEPCLPSWACKYSSGLTGSAYRACGEMPSALDTMALLQVHQAKALRDLHKGDNNLAVLHELCAEMDLVLRGMNVTAQSMGRVMSMLVVQERNLWLCLADMKEQEKVQFLNARRPASLATLLRALPSSFSAAQKQTEATKHVKRRRKPAASTPLPFGYPSSHAAAAAAFHQAGHPARPGGLGGEYFVWFCFCSTAGPAASSTQNISKRVVSSVSGSQEEEIGGPCIPETFPSSSLASSQQWVALYSFTDGVLVPCRCRLWLA